MSKYGRRARGFLSGARITQGALWLLLIEAGMSLVFLFANEQGQAWMVKYLVATDRAVWGEGKVWTLFTTMFVEPRFVALLFHGLMLWMFVPALEKWWGLKRFLVFAVVTSATAALIGSLAGTFVAAPQPIAGLDAFIFASIIAYGVIFSKSQVYFFAVLPLSGKQLAYGMTGFVALMVLIGQEWASGAGWGAAMLLTLFLTSDKLSPRLWWLQWRHKRVRRHLKLVKDDKDKRWIN